MAVFRLVLILGLFVVGYKTKSVLILGGNGFLGGEATKQLSNAGHKVTVLNRGNQYFDSARRLHPYIHEHIECDRKTLLRETCKELIDSSGYDVIIDFSSYEGHQIEQIIDLFHKKTSLYIFISTDAVYDVRDKNHTGRTLESDSLNPIPDRKQRDKVFGSHKYGLKKFECEERLRDQRSRFGMPFIILRLADAIGARDTTQRWWVYQVWMKLQSFLDLPVPMPRSIMDVPFR